MPNYRAYFMKVSKVQTAIVKETSNHKRTEGQISISRKSLSNKSNKFLIFKDFGKFIRVK